MRIRSVDLESTGEAPPAGIVEIGYCDVVGEGRSWRVAEPPHAELCNPGMPIPPEISAIHHIIDEDVASFSGWETVAPYILRNHEGSEQITALAAHFAKFEKLWITDAVTPLPFICTFKCAMKLWPDAPSHSNGALRYWRKPVGLERDMASPAHRAGPDAYVTAHHLRDMLNEGAALDDLLRWSSEPALLVRVNFGKHRGSKWVDVPTGYLDWCVSQKDMNEDVIYTAKQELKRRGNVR